MRASGLGAKAEGVDFSESTPYALGMDTKEMLYVVGFFEGDDMIGGLNILGIFSSKDEADRHAKSNETIFDMWGLYVVEIPLNTPGYLGYGMNKFNEWK